MHKSEVPYLLIPEIYQAEMVESGYFVESLARQICGVIGDSDGKEKA